MVWCGVGKFVYKFLVNKFVVVRVRGKGGEMIRNLYLEYVDFLGGFINVSSYAFIFFNI